MKNQKRPYVGDVIITNHRFSPKEKNINNENIVGLKGIIVTRIGQTFGVRFKNGLTFTNYLNGLLSHPTGYFLERDEFEIYPEN